MDFFFDHITSWSHVADEIRTTAQILVPSRLNIFFTHLFQHFILFFLLAGSRFNKVCCCVAPNTERHII